MSRSIDQVERLIALIPYLKAHPGVSVAQVAQDFGVRPAKIKQDVRKLFLCGLPGGMPDDLIELDLDALESEGVIRIDNADFLRGPIRLFRSEAVSLVLALHSIRSTADPETAELIDGTIAKLEGAMGEPAPVAVHVHAVDDAILSTVTDAVARGERLEIVYANVHRDTQSRREVDPLGLFTEQSQTYLNAWCHQARERRTFRVDAITEARAVGVAIESRRASTARVTARYSPAEDDHWADFDISTQGRWLLEMYANDVLETGEDHTRVRLRSHDAGWLVRFALRHAAVARILAPADLVDQVRRTASHALDAYDGR